jgi:hypothetical protein
MCGGILMIGKGARPRLEEFLVCIIEKIMKITRIWLSFELVMRLFSAIACIRVVKKN